MSKKTYTRGQKVVIDKWSKKDLEDSGLSLGTTRDVTNVPFQKTRGYKQKGWSPFTKGDNPIKKKIKEFKAWKKKQHSKYNIIEATVPDIPIGPGAIKKGKGLLNTFSKIAKRRKKQSDLIQKSLEAKGYTFTSK